MKPLIIKLIIPLTVISFVFFTKWWYTLPVDAPDTMFSGFPFPYVGDGWHTSGALQFFVTEFLADVAVYFLFWLLSIYVINRFLISIRPHKIAVRILWAFTGLMLVLISLSLSLTDNLFYLKRPYDMEVMETGYKFFGQHIARPDYYNYHPEGKPN